jgi:hypothetical protein
MKAIIAVSTLVVCAGAAVAQNPSRGVVKLTAKSLFSKRMGTGICIDTPCVHVLTNYHVLALLGKRLKVEGVPIASSVSATGPQDSGAIDVRVAGTISKFNPSRDLALLTLQRALPAQFRGLPFANYKPSVGQQVKRIARYGNAYDTDDGKVVADELRFESLGQVVSLDGHFLLDCITRPGNSGGAVLDGEGRVLGLVEIRSTDEVGRTGTVVLPAAIISGFLREKDPTLWAALFHKPAARAVAAKAKYPDWPVALDRQPTVTDETRDLEVPIRALRTQVAASLGAMQRMIAQQNMRFWGDGAAEQAWQFEVAIYSEGQRFRTKAGKETGVLPGPKAGILPGSEWYDTLARLARARLSYLGTSSHAGKPVHVFVFDNTGADEVCPFRQRTAVLFGHKEETRYVDCRGTVVADESFNVVGITERLSPQFGFVSDWQSIALYGFLQLHEAHEPYLVPLNMDLSARFKNGKVYYASARWSAYHLWVAESALRAQ